MRTRAVFGARTAAACAVVACIVLIGSVAGAQYCGAPGVTAPQCDGQCPFGQMCADGGGTCHCVTAEFRLRQPRQPERPAGLLGRVSVGDASVRDLRGRLHVRPGSEPLRQRHARSGRGLRGRQHDRRRRLRLQLHADRRAATASRPAAKSATARRRPVLGRGVSPTARVRSAPPTNAQIRCFVAISKVGIKFVKGNFKIFQAMPRDGSLRGHVRVPPRRARQAPRQDRGPSSPSVAVSAPLPFTTWGFPVVVSTPMRRTGSRPPISRLASSRRTATSSPSSSS